MAYPKAWQETFLMTVTPEGGDDYELVGRTTGLSIKLGDKDITQIVLNNGGRITKFEEEGITEISFDEYTLGADDPNGLFQLFFGDLSGTTQPISVTNTRTRKQVRIAIMWTTDSTVTSAAGATADGEAALRITAKDGYLTAYQPDFGDKVLKTPVTFKFVPYDKSGNGLITVESTDGSTGATLAALSSY